MKRSNREILEKKRKLWGLSMMEHLYHESQITRILAYLMDRNRCLQFSQLFAVQRNIQPNSSESHAQPR